MGEEDWAYGRRELEQHTAEVGGGGSRAEVGKLALERSGNNSKQKIKLDTNRRFAMGWRKFISQRTFFL